MFETAIRNKYRFSSEVGMIGVEDLWQLSIERLDTVYKRLNSELKQIEEESLLIESPQNQEINDKIKIVKHVFSTKVAEKEERVQKHERSKKKQYLLSLMQEKQHDEYKGKTTEELQALINEL